MLVAPVSKAQIEVVEEVGTPWDNCWDWGDGDYLVGPQVFFFDDAPDGTPEFVEWLTNNNLCDEGSIYYNGEWNMDASNPQPISE